MGPLLAWLIPFFSHNLNRFIGVVVVGALLIGGPILIYKNIYNRGFHKGYAQCLVEHPPTTITGGTTTINQNGSREPFFTFLKVGKFRLLAL